MGQAFEGKQYSSEDKKHSSEDEQYSKDIDLIHKTDSFIVIAKQRLDALDQSLEDVECVEGDREEIVYYIEQLSPIEFRDIQNFLDNAERSYEQSQKTKKKSKQINHFRRRVMMSC